MGLTATATPIIISSSGSSMIMVSASAAGDYSVTIKATSGPLSHTIAVIIHVLDYSLTGSPINLVAPIGSNPASTLTLRSLDGYAGNVSLTFTVQTQSTAPPATDGLGGRPPLIMAPPAILPNVSFNPQSFLLTSNGSEQSTVTISLPTSLPAGNYLITMTASDGTLSHTTVLTVVATDFSLTATQSSLSLPAGSNRTITLNLQSLNFFQGNVTLTVTGTNGGPTGTVSSSTVQLTIYSNVNLNLTIQVPSATAPGNYTITIQAISGTISHALSVSITVTSGLTTILSEILSHHFSTSISAVAIFTLLTILAMLNVRTYQRRPSTYRPRRIEGQILRASATSRLSSYSSSVLMLWRTSPRDEN
jgi:hypothetical protein